jgi:hypothetical protein
LVTLPPSSDKPAIAWHLSESANQDAAFFMNSRHQLLSGILFDEARVDFGDSEIDYQSVTYALIESANDAIPFIDSTGIKGDVVGKLRAQIDGN